MNKLCASGYCSFCIQRINIRRFRQLNNNGICVDCEKYQKRLGIFVEAKIKVEPKPTKVTKPKYIKATNPLLKIEEERLVEVFYQLQNEGIGRNWRTAAAKRIDWSNAKVKQTAKRARQKTEMIPVSIEQQLTNKLTHEWQTAYQISAYFPNLKFDWIFVNLNKLGSDGKIDCHKCQPNKNQYRLKNDSKTLRKKLEIRP